MGLAMPGTEPQRRTHQRSGRLLWIAGLCVGILSGAIVAIGLTGVIS